MTVTGVGGAVVRRIRTSERPDAAPRQTRVAFARKPAPPAPEASHYPELDCVRNLLPRHVITAAEYRARLIGLGADRALICADAMTEEAYLTALAASLGTSYEPLDRCSRTDCPLDGDQLVQAAAAGLLPLYEGDRIVWIIAPRGLTARRLADPRQSRPGWLQAFRLTSAERLCRFVARHTQGTLGRRAADGLRLTRPLLSNAPRPRGWRVVIAVEAVALAGIILALVPALTIEACVLLCAIFLAAAALRLSCAAYAQVEPRRSPRIDDAELPIYTIICALYHEAAVIDDLIDAIRALDYPGIMAQTPQAV